MIGGVDEPGICRCGHYSYVHPCKGWNTGRTLRLTIPLYGQLVLLRRCRCTTPREATK